MVGLILAFVVAGIIWYFFRQRRQGSKQNERPIPIEKLQKKSIRVPGNEKRLYYLCMCRYLNELDSPLNFFTLLSSTPLLFSYVFALIMLTNSCRIF